MIFGLPLGRVVGTMCRLSLVCVVVCLYNTPFTRSSKDRADIEQTSSKHQAGLMEPHPLSQMYAQVQPTADHVLYKPSNYNSLALLISMIIIIARRASWMFARSCKRSITHAKPYVVGSRRWYRWIGQAKTSSFYRLQAFSCQYSPCLYLQRFGRNLKHKVAACSHYPRAPNCILALIVAFDIATSLYSVSMGNCNPQSGKSLSFRHQKSGAGLRYYFRS